jgi:hypothetical protein
MKRSVSLIPIVMKRSYVYVDAVCYETEECVYTSITWKDDLVCPVYVDGG